MSLYATTEQFRSYGYQSKAQDEAGQNDYLERASRIFDLACGVPENFFAASEDAEATELEFYGDGTRYLKISPYVEIDEVSVPTGYTVPDYRESNGYLVTDSGYIWPRDVKVTVSAVWGYGAVPADVVEAVLEIAVAIWRTKDAVWSRVVQADGSVQVNDALPPRAKMVVDKRKMAQAVFV